MKRILTTGLLLLIAFIAGFAIAKVEQPSKVITSQVEPENEVKVINILTESTENFYLEYGDYGIELSDGSWGVVNEYTNTYIFQPADLGDWDYQVDTLEQFENLVRTYVGLKNR